jgi:hypothetical protein
MDLVIYLPTNGLQGPLSLHAHQNISSLFDNKHTYCGAMISHSSFIFTKYVDYNFQIVFLT